MGTEEDFELTRSSIRATVEDDEHVRFDVDRVAQLEWDENPAPGRPEMTGQWRLDFRDGSGAEIDRQRTDLHGAVEAARTLIAEWLANPR